MQSLRDLLIEKLEVCFCVAHITRWNYKILLESLQIAKTKNRLSLRADSSL